LEAVMSDEPEFRAWYVAQAPNFGEQVLVSFFVAHVSNPSGESASFAEASTWRAVSNVWLFSSSHLRDVLAAVSDCYRTFDIPTDARALFTREHLVACGCTIEGFETQPALPQGWTDGFPGSRRSDRGDRSNSSHYPASFRAELRRAPNLSALVGDTMSSIIDDASGSARTGTDKGLQEVLDFLVTQEQLSVTALTAAIERANGTPSAAFLPVMRNGVTTEFNHLEALTKAGGQPLTTKYWVPDAAFDNGGVGLFSAFEIVESVEISLYLIGVSAYTRARDEQGARMCAEAMGTEAVHRALFRFAQGQLGKDVGVPNDVGFENFDWTSLSAVRDALEGLGIGYGKQGNGAGRFYEYPGNPAARGIGTPVSHTIPA
jgi:hypothetical protein